MDGRSGSDIGMWRRIKPIRSPNSSDIAVIGTIRKRTKVRGHIDASVTQRGTMHTAALPAYLGYFVLAILTHGDFMSGNRSVGYDPTPLYHKMPCRGCVSSFGLELIG